MSSYVVGIAGRMGDQENQQFERRSNKSRQTPGAQYECQLKHTTGLRLITVPRDQRLSEPSHQLVIAQHRLISAELLRRFHGNIPERGPSHKNLVCLHEVLPGAVGLIFFFGGVWLSSRDAREL